MRNLKRVVQEGGLDDIRRALRARDEAERSFRRDLLFAHDAGSSYRAIGETIDMSYETVRRIVDQQAKLRAADRAYLERPINPLLSVGNRKREVAKRAAIRKKWQLPPPEPGS